MIFGLAVIFFILGMLVGYLCGRQKGVQDGYKLYEISNVITLSDTMPEKETRKNFSMKLQNEIADFIYVADGKICLDVISHADNDENKIIEYVEVSPDVYEEEEVKE